MERLLNENEIILECLETPDYILWVSNEEIEQGDNNLTNGRDIFNYRDFSEYSIEYANRYWRKVIGYQPRKENVKPLMLPLVPEMINDDVENLAEINSEKHHYAFGQQSEFYQLGFIEGHKSASKRFSKEDILHLEWLYNRMKSVHKENENYDYMLKFKEIIKSLKQPKPKWFIVKRVVVSDDIDHMYTGQVRMGPKTITNDKGEKVLVGYYKFE